MSSEKKRISISTKIFSIAASFALPIAVLLYLMISSINSYIDFGSKEWMGNRYQSPLEDLLQHIQNYQIALHSCGSDRKTCINQANQEKEKIDLAFIKLNEVNQRYGETLQFTEEGLKKRNRQHQQVQTVQNEWQQLASEIASGTSLAANSDKKFNHLVEDIRTMITHSGDTSNLILDPDLDSYYLMDVTLLALPQMQDRLAQMIMSGTEALKKVATSTTHSITQDERIQFTTNAALLHESDLNRTVSSSQTSMNEDANFYGVSPTLSTIQSPLETLRNTTSHFLAMTREIATSQQTTVSADAYLRAGMEAREASFAYWNIAVKELDKLLETRIQHYRNSRLLGLILAAIAVILASLGAFVLMRSIVTPLRSLADSLNKGEGMLDTCVERIYDLSQGEFADKKGAMAVCKELSSHAKDIRNVVQELNSHVQGLGSKTTNVSSRGS